MLKMTIAANVEYKAVDADCTKCRICGDATFNTMHQINIRQEVNGVTEIVPTDSVLCDSCRALQ